MRPARIRNQDKTIVRLASRTAIQKYFSTRDVAARSTGWIDAGNRYRETATATYRSDFMAVPKAVDETALISYIAASAPAHAIDGWSFLARSTDAVLRGDMGAAVHLAYYSELRAAMSLLACDGIGIFDNRHPVIAKSGTVTTSISKALFWNGTSYNERPVGTHAVVWPLLSHWSSLKRTAGLINELVAPDGMGLSAWLSALGVPRPIRAISKTWFKNWGIDLSILSEDHEARNIVSYRPAEFRLPPALTAARANQFVSSLWRLFEPSAGGRFLELERALLRKVIRDTGAAVNASSLETAGLDPAKAAQWVSYLAEVDDPEPIALADKSSDVDSAECALEVISRAALLLFLATGSTRGHLIEAGYTGRTLEFFWKRQCETRFDGPAASLPDDPIDLWRDVADHLDDSTQWLHSTSDATLGQWRSAQAQATNKIVSLELAGVWGLAT